MSDAFTDAYSYQRYHLKGVTIIHLIDKLDESTVCEKRDIVKEIMSNLRRLHSTWSLPTFDKEKEELEKLLSSEDCDGYKIMGILRTIRYELRRILL